MALITGASGGIGQAIARGLAAEGAAVGLGYGSHAEPTEKLAEEIVAAGGLAVAVGADLRRTETADELVDAVEAQLGAVEVLVAAAGLGRRQGLEEVADLAIAILRNSYVTNQVVSIDGGTYPR